jgi:hypothetical protein
MIISEVFAELIRWITGSGFYFFNLFEWKPPSGYLKKRRLTVEQVYLEAGYGDFGFFS